MERLNARSFMRIDITRNSNMVSDDSFDAHADDCLFLYWIQKRKSIRKEDAEMLCS